MFNRFGRLTESKKGPKEKKYLYFDYLCNLRKNVYDVYETIDIFKFSIITQSTAKHLNLETNR